MQLLECSGVLLDALLAKFDVQRLVLNLLAQVIVLAVVAYVVLLLFVAGDGSVVILNLHAAVADLRLKVFDLVLDVQQAGLQALNLIGDIFYLLRQFTREGT